MPPKKKGLGPTFSCRLREDQDRSLRAEADFHGIPLSEMLRRRLDKAQAAIEDEAACAEVVSELGRQQALADPA